MSCWEDYEGRVRELKPMEGDSFVDLCRKLCNSYGLKSDDGDWVRRLWEECSEYDLVVLRDRKRVFDIMSADTWYEEDGMYDGRMEDNGEIAFKTRYYNGGESMNCAIAECIGNALEINPPQ